MTFTLTILGSNSAKPTLDRHPTAQVLQVGNDLYLIDCGEGTQMQLLKYGIKTSKITHIFISHLHGDHFLGLIPLLDTFMLTNRDKPLHLYAPPDFMPLFELYRKITANGHTLCYELIFHPTDARQTGVIMENDLVTVRTLPMLHRIDCTGFLFTLKPKERRMIPAAIEQYQIHYHSIPDIKKGADFVTPQGEVIPNQLLTTSPPPPLSYAFCSDTAYNEQLISLITGANVLYHESTYLEEMQSVVAKRGHSTSIDAARIAKAAHVERLYLGHFSSQYDKLDKFLHEAVPFFPNTYLATEGLVIDIAKGK